MGGVGFSLRDGGREIDAGGRTIPFAMISEAEMLALHDLLESAIGNGIKELTAYSDSTLIVGIFEAGGQCSLPHLLESKGRLDPSLPGSSPLKFTTSLKNTTKALLL